MGVAPAADSAFAVIRRGRRVLLVRTRRVRWQFPGGRLKRREKHWTAARRETLEETGLRVDLLDLTGIYARSDGSCAIVFVARAADGNDVAEPRNEITEQRWVRWREAKRLLSRKKRQRLRDALSSRRSFRRKRERIDRWRAVIRRSG